jgi:RES domain-containing protein
MTGGRRARDHQLLDALGALEPEPFEGTVWRAVRDGRRPLEGSSAGGRWSPGHFDVVYTSLDPDGARAEVYFHLTRQPVFPSRLRYWLYELNLKTKETLRLASTEALLGLGVEEARYREVLYDRTQAISDAAQFMGFDGLIVPSARWDCLNLVLFADSLDLDEIDIEEKSAIDWEAWRNRPR